MLILRACPVVSLSRRTDMPAFFPDRCRDLFDGNAVRAAVFWSKNPEPLYPYLAELPPVWYFQYTINDYEREGYEPNVPPLRDRVATLQKISDEFGKMRCVWRFDPILLDDNLTYATIIAKFERIAAHVGDYIDQCIVSYIDLYGHVAARLSPTVRVPNQIEVMEIEGAFARIAQQYGFTIAYCAETSTTFSPARCVDYRRLFAINAMQERPDTELWEYLTRYMDSKDMSQRSRCHCNPAIDLGEYGTCRHHCTYCYAQKSEVSDQQTGLGAF